MMMMKKMKIKKTVISFINFVVILKIIGSIAFIYCAYCLIMFYACMTSEMRFAVFSLVVLLLSRVVLSNLCP